MKEKTVECPACGTAGARSAPPIVDIAADPDILERLLTGAFFEWMCPGCARRFFVNDVLLCLHPEHGYGVYLVPGYKDAALPIPTIYRSRCKGTLRVAASFVDFVEKLRIFENGLDDRVIEAMKAVYATVSSQSGQGSVCQMYFEAEEPDGRLTFAVLREYDETSVSIPREAYDRAAEDFCPLFPGDDGSEFVRVDKVWLESAFQDASADE
jgi:hypothetical protein